MYGLTRMHLKMLKRDKHANTKEVEQALIPLRHLVYNCKVDRKKVIIRGDGLVGHYLYCKKISTEL